MASENDNLGPDAIASVREFERNNAMSSRIFTVETPIEITFNTIRANVSTTLSPQEGRVPTADQLVRASMRLSPAQVFFGEVSGDQQRVHEFLASVDTRFNRPE